MDEYFATFNVGNEEDSKSFCIFVTDNFLVICYIRRKNLKQLLRL